jgi:hypothetical protein
MNFNEEYVARLLDDCSRMLECAANKGIEIKPPVAEKNRCREMFVARPDFLLVTDRRNRGGNPSPALSS